MIVETIVARGEKDTGRIAVTFTMTPEVFQAMARAAKDGGHPDTADYIAAVINTAFMQHGPEPEPNPVDGGNNGDDGIPF